MFSGKTTEDSSPRPQVAVEIKRDPSAAPVAARPQAAVALQPAAVVRPPVAAAVPKPVAAPVSSANGAQLIAGPGVTLKGNMHCDMLRVEGAIEGDVKARKLVVAAGGALLGTAEIEDAEIEGKFEGTLAVAGLLVVRNTGRLSGKIQYGDIEIERGGAISGEVVAAGQAAVPSGTATARNAEPDAKPMRNGLFGKS